MHTDGCVPFMRDTVWGLLKGNPPDNTHSEGFPLNWRQTNQCFPASGSNLRAQLAREVDTFTPLEACGIESDMSTSVCMPKARDICTARGMFLLPFGEEYVLFSPVGFNGNLSLLEIFIFFQGT